MNNRNIDNDNFLDFLKYKEFLYIWDIFTEEMIFEDGVI